MILKAMPDAVIVGSQTAGADGNITRFKISHEIYAGFTSLGTFYPDKSETQRIGIVPDSVVYQTPESIRQEKDLVLEKALEVAGCDPSAVPEDMFVDNQISIYPNPAENHITISGIFGKTKIYNPLGVEVWCGFINLERDIPLTNLSPGMYLIKSEKGSARFVKY